MDNCPKCNGEDFTRGLLNFDFREIWRKMVCKKCGFMWNEVYKFSHIEDPDTGEVIVAE